MASYYHKIRRLPYLDRTVQPFVTKVGLEVEKAEAAEHDCAISVTSIQFHFKLVQIHFFFFFFEKLVFCRFCKTVMPAGTVAWPIQWSGCVCTMTSLKMRSADGRVVKNGRQNSGRRPFRITCPHAAMRCMAIASRSLSEYRTFFKYLRKFLFFFFLFFIVCAFFCA